MTNQEKMRMLEEIFELDENYLTEDSVLKDIVEYDSMAKLSLIVLCDDEFDKKLTGEQIREFETVRDILNFLN
ncbi:MULTISPECIES: acyl carrier protein [unclassified Butyricimonas]|uniref:acyl carrier protein n=1 Tax=unclassified Butyricimonas TaxID=2637652 RepID=UPI000C07A031|nr:MULTISPECIES: acyl carrier protein [unclassified Butyricimonas]